jgi:hypothetical protein
MIVDQAMAPRRITDEDGAQLDVFALPTDEATLLALLRHLFETHWDKIVFGPLIQGAAWEIRASVPPTKVGMLDGYLTVAFDAWHFHLCIGDHKGSHRHPTPPALARHRRTARAELFRRLDPAGDAVSWGLRLFNGAGEQQITIFFPNPFLSADGERVLRQPDWTQLALWDELRARYTGAAGPDPADRAAKRFHHD